MTISLSTSKKPRKQHTPEFRNEVLKLAERIGVAATARELSLYEYQLYAWRSRINNARYSSESEQEIYVEIARLKHQLAEGDEEPAIIQKAATYFAKLLKRSMSLSKSIGLSSALKLCVGYCGSLAAAGIAGVCVIISQARASSSGSSVMLLSVRHSRRQNSVMVRTVLLRSCRCTTSKPLPPACGLRGFAQRLPVSSARSATVNTVCQCLTIC